MSQKILVVFLRFFCATFAPFAFKVLGGFGFNPPTARAAPAAAGHQSL